MNVFVTGASGFVGSAIVSELLHAGHRVIGLARSEQSAKMVRQAGADVLMGDLEDPDILRQGATQADGVIHTAFSQDLTAFSQSARADKVAIEVMGEALLNTNKPLITTSGTLGLPTVDGWITEESVSPETSPRFSESATLALAGKGVYASVVRLSPNVHGSFGKGFRAGFALTQLEVAKRTGMAAYIGDGSNRLPAVHRLDAAKLFVLALEKRARGIRYHAVDNQPLLRAEELAQLISEKADVPVKSLDHAEAQQHFGPLYWFLSVDNPATSRKTQNQLGWTPTHIGLAGDFRQRSF